MIFAADYPFMDIFWTMVVFFAWAIWVAMVILVLIDLFKHPGLSGMTKAAWVLLIVILPFIGVLTYLVVHGKGMGERSHRGRSPSRQSQATAEIAAAQRLFDSGAFSEPEFARIKAGALD